MLVLSRNESEQVIIGTGDDRITVTIVQIRRDKVIIGFDAPREISVHRREVYEAIHGTEGDQNESEK